MLPKAPPRKRPSLDTPPQDEPHTSSPQDEPHTSSPSTFDALPLQEQRNVYQYLRVAMAKQELLDVHDYLEETDGISKQELLNVILIVERIENNLYSALSLKDANIPKRRSIRDKGN